uniref:Myb-like domain-containing protein n=1 Tax=Anopheles minimus TaxID=112268 RepID=A0A182W3E1_9DIPT
ALLNIRISGRCKQSLEQATRLRISYASRQSEIRYLSFAPQRFRRIEYRVEKQVEKWPSPNRSDRIAQLLTAMENAKTARKESSSSEDTSCGLLTDFHNDIRPTGQSTPAAPKQSTSSAPKRQVRRKRKRMSFPNDDEEVFDQNFEETIKTAADKNNLTPMCVKKLLKKIVVNDHVFAMVRLKEEEEEAKKLRMDESKKSQNDDNEDDDDDDEKEQPEPKLTRLKAKQLKQTPFPIASLNEPTPDEEVAALIHQELSSDDDDEEYKPAEDETASDEDPNTTVSDVDSQPRTPVSTAACMEQDHESEVQYTKDGLFKIPKPRNDSHCSQSELEHEQENIALRTRSKLCLTTTAIETLESTFVPPDITNDMYEYDGEMDQAWKDFLEEFTKPLPNNLDDDDDNDPEYVATEGIPLDPEEMRAVKVSKKELNALVMELMEMGGTDDQMLEQTLTETINESLNCQLDDRSDMLSTPVPEVHDMVCDNGAIQSTMVRTDSSMHSEPFSAVSMLPPESSTNEPTHTTQQLDSMQSNFNSTAMCTSAYFPPRTDQNTLMVSGNNASNVVDASLNSSGCNMQMSLDEANHSNGSLERTFLEDCSPKPRFFVKCSDLEEVTLEDDSLPCTRIYKHPLEKRYRVRSTTVPIDVNISETEPGMNDIQMQLLQQQLRMHVQLTAQHFLQTYKHPVFHNMAKTFRNMLTEFEDIGKAKPHIVPWNLPFAVECCQMWEKKMDEKRSDTISLKKYWNEEIIREQDSRDRWRRIHRSELHWLVKETILNSKAFIYPSLIPWKAFRCLMLSHSQNSFGSEKQYVESIRKCLFAVWLERGLNHLKKLETIRAFFLFRSNQQYFVKNGYAPPFEHVLEVFDPEKVILLSQYHKGTLHFNWEADIFTNRKARHRIYRTKSPAKQCKVGDESSQTPPSVKTSHASDVLLNVTVLLPVESGPTTKDRKDVFCLQTSEKQKINTVNNEAPVSEVVAIPYGKFVVNIGHDASVENNINNIYAESATTAEVTNAVTQRSAHTFGSVENQDISVPVITECESDGKRADTESSANSRHRSHATDAVAQQCTSLAGQVVGKGSREYGNYSRSAAVATLYSAMRRYLQELKNQCKQELVAACLRSRANRIIFRVYSHVKQLEIYSRFLDNLRTMSENYTAYRYKALPQCYFQQSQQGLLRLSCNHSADGSFIVGAEYIQEQFDDYQSMDDKDALYAFNYYEKVEETLIASDRADLLERFEHILRNFDEIEDRASSLYYQIEDLLGESFPQLVDAFLTFLLPGQAAQVGKFFEHFILTNMGDFLEKLNVFFAKQPSQIKKIHACLNELSNEPDVTMEQVKTKVLPLLKGSTLLTEWFLQLFPGQRPSESPISEYEHVAMKKHPTNDGCDAAVVYEHISYIETLPDGPENPCASNGIRYIQGRIFQGALPARLTFLANSCVIRAVNQATENTTANGDNLCDDSTLMAHAIRLNPLVHSAKGITYADVAHLLVEQNGESEVGSSPETPIASTNMEDADNKTGGTSKKLTPKLPLKKRFNSPISRKAGISVSDERSSPGGGNKESTTPKRLAVLVPVTIPPDSKALAASRKMRSLLDTPQTSSQEEPQLDDPCSMVTMSKCNTNERLEAVENSQPTANATADCSANVEMQEPTPKPSASNETKRVEEAPCWTRDEDKIILQDIVKGFSSVDTVVRQISQKIPDRSSEQIRDRFEFLHRMLRQVKQK